MNFFENNDIEEQIQKRVNEYLRIASDMDLVPLKQFSKLIDCVRKTFSNGGTVAFAGNGGSAAEAMHIAAEFIGKCRNPHKPLPAICLNESQSVITAIGNDFGFDLIFVRSILAYLRPQDLLILLSTSGKSPNIIEAIKVANQIGVQTYLWTGLAAADMEGVEIIRAPSFETPRIQEVHLLWGHILSEIIELEFPA